MTNFSRYFYIALLLLASPARLQANEDALMLMYNDLDPYLTSKSGQVSGLLATYLNNVVKDAGIKPLWRNIQWEKQLSILKRNQRNVCAVALFKTEERETFSRFTAPIGMDKGFVLVSINSNKAMKQHMYFKDVLNDKNLKPILQRNTVYNPYVNKLLAEKKLPKLGRSIPRMMRMLLINPHSYIIVTPIMGRTLIEKTGLSDALTAYDHYKDLTDAEPYYIACSLGTDNVLFERLNTSIKKHGITEVY